MVVLRDAGEVVPPAAHGSDLRRSLGRAVRPGHAGGAGALGRSAGRADVARRHRRARERLAARRVRQPCAPARRRTFGCSLARSCRASVRTTASSSCPTATSSPRTSAACSPDTTRPRTRPKPTELLALDPDTLDIVATCALPEPSIARLSADGDDVYVVGTRSLFRVHWDGARLGARRRRSPPATGRVEGQTYGWDAVLALGAAWFLDNGAGSERYAGHVPRARGSRARRCTSCASTWRRRLHAHRDLRPARRHRREPARRRRGPAHRRRVRQRQRCARRLRHRGRRLAPRRAGGASRTTRATRCCSPTPASSSPTTTTRR